MRPCRAAAGVLVLLAVAGCGAAREPVAAPVPRVEPPPADGTFDYQIGGAYPPAAGVTIVERDVSQQAAPGVYSICYVNAFQTQPEAAGWWTANHPDLLLRSAGGAPVEDPEWAGELLLDTSTDRKRRGVAAVVTGWIDDCARRGFRAVEPDNLDAWTRSGGLLDRAGALALARTLTDHAHRRGLAVAQKNAAELGDLGRTAAGFDFAVAEECQEFDECDAYTDVYGDRVIEIEYTDGPPGAFAAACRARGARISVLLRDRDVVPAGHPDHRTETC